MLNNETKEPIGSLRISKDVIATISTVATREIEGVAELAPLSTNIKSWLIKKQTTRPVAISLKDDIAVIDINVVLRANVNIPKVCRNIQTAVKEAVQNMTSITVSKVNVSVADICFDAVPAVSDEN